MKLANLIKKYEETLHRISGSQAQDCINTYRMELTDLDDGAEDEILEGLIRMHGSRNWHNAMLLLMAAETHLSDQYRSVLCDILNLKDPIFPNEYAIEVLASVVDASCLNVLSGLVHHQFSGDPDRQIAIKAMDAIADIDHPSAIALLKQLSLSEDPRLAEEAGYLLNDE